MAIQQPVGTDKLNSPDHSLSHRVFANDSAAPVQSITVDSNGNVDFTWPYGSFSSTADQTCTSGTTADAITYDTTDIASNITLSNNSRINIAVAGTYLITYSAVGKSAAPNKTLDIWLSVSGTNVTNSNTVSKFVGSANERIITVTYIYQFTAGQYFELYMWSDDNGTKLEATGTQTNPTRPACPSIIVTVNKISE